MRNVEKLLMTITMIWDSKLKLLIAFYLKQNLPTPLM